MQMMVPKYAEALAELKTDGDLYERLQFLVADLLNLKDDDRWIWDVLHPCSTEPADVERGLYFSTLYLPSLYFSEDERLRLSQFPTITGMRFSETLTAAVQNKFTELSASASSTGAHVCSSHDLAPLFRLVFDLDNNFYTAGEFKKRHFEFERKIKKKMAKLLQKEETVRGKPNDTAAANASMSSSPTTAASFLPPVRTPQAVKLRALRVQLAELEFHGQTDAKLAKQIQALDKEVARIANKKQNLGVI